MIHNEEEPKWGEVGSMDKELRRNGEQMEWNTAELDSVRRFVEVVC